ncbi:gamma-glutamyltransferase family protein [Ketogulonicigenium vulgare]|uniref:gamma-glutamyltransferase family protein n=1 Tax=Ketogulonicigenium vulgare TaxID=92945 RepID=UPI00235957F5|nr:gamma-glutamyltransferase [Ketogulonicigenium vulgare]
MTAAIATPHPLATAAGQKVLDAGGTAPEAVIAAGAVLTVVMPHFCGLGGDAVWTLSDRNGDSRCLLAIGQGIQRDRPSGPVPFRGPASILTTAAVVDGWAEALDYAHVHLGGRASWQSLLAPAFALAWDGFAVTSSQGYWTDFRAPEIADWPGFDGLFLQNGASLPVGHLLQQPDLACVFAKLIDNGPRDFYEGAVAARIIAGLQETGAIIGADDLRQTRSRWAAPVSLGYRGHTLLSSPPPTQGLTTLQIMGILAQFDLADIAPSSAAHFHLCVEAVKRAFEDRGRIADGAAVDDLLAPDHLGARAADISTQQAMAWPHPWQHGDTVFLGAIDAMGNAASVLQSTFYDWGSGVVVPGTGIIWQNRGAAFSFQPGHPNMFRPGKLPFYTLNPGIALDDAGRPAFVYGTQGADGQPQTLAMLLSLLLDYGLPPDQALAAPRFLLGRTFSDQRDSLKVEGHAGDAVIAQLKTLGHQVSAIAPLSPLAGQAGVISPTLGGHHDPR